MSNITNELEIPLQCNLRYYFSLTTRVIQRPLSDLVWYILIKPLLFYLKITADPKILSAQDKKKNRLQAYFWRLDHRFVLKLLKLANHIQLPAGMWVPSLLAHKALVAWPIRVPLEAFTAKVSHDVVVFNKKKNGGYPIRDTIQYSNNSKVGKVKLVGKVDHGSIMVIKGVWISGPKQATHFTIDPAKSDPTANNLRRTNSPEFLFVPYSFYWVAVSLLFSSGLVGILGGYVYRQYLASFFK